MLYNILITCPPMIKQINKYKKLFSDNNIRFFCPEFSQVMSERELIDILPNYDGWIIGDDPATRKVFEAGKKGKLKAAVKWGVGTDNVDFNACRELKIPIKNIPNVFGEEVSDIAIGMLLCITRKLHIIDNETKKGNWIKPVGSSLTGKKVCLIGLGDIGRHTAKKLLAFNLDVWASEPACSKVNGKIKYNYGHGFSVYTPELTKLLDSINCININTLDNCLSDANYIIITCSLNKNTKHLINKNNLLKASKGVKIINVARGPIVNENDVIELLEEGFIDSVGFDVFEQEPLSKKSGLRKFNQNIYGSHNGSNTIEAVDKTSHIAIDILLKYLN